jgi:hypothetical protein
LDVESVADIAPQRFPSRTTRHRAMRSRARALTKVDMRSVAGKRIAELRALFAATLQGAGLELTPMRQYLIRTAAEATALAEHGRGRYLRGEGSDLSDVVSAERRADAAVKRLGLPIEGAPADQRQQGGQAAPAHDLSQLSNDQLDRLHALLSEAKEGPPAASPTHTHDPKTADAAQRASMGRETAGGP